MFLINFIDNVFNFTNEADVQHYAKSLLESEKFNYIVRQHKCGVRIIDDAFPSKSGIDTKGRPDLLICTLGNENPVCVWENKDPRVNITLAINEAKFYIEGLFQRLPKKPSLPRIAVGFNGHELACEFYTNEFKWVQIKNNGEVIKDAFFKPEIIKNGISNQGLFLADNGWATSSDLRELLPKLKNIYRYIPSLTQGRKPIDFTIALLTLRMLVERNPSWGTWSEQPSFSVDADNIEQAVRERFKTLTDRVASDKVLSSKYGEIFNFNENNDGDEISFSFINTLNSIPTTYQNFEKIFTLIDSLPPLEHSDFDIFGEVYQSIGDNATKKALGQFFTGRHVISSILPVLMKRSGLDEDEEKVKSIRVCDPACGTGGFLTETFRIIKSNFKLDDAELKRLSKKAFYGFDLSHSNASRASVNMYFAGDGFSKIKGGVDSLDKEFEDEYKNYFDFVVTNPPYGKSNHGRAEEAFLDLAIKILKPGGWGVIVLPNGVLENPRSKYTRANLLKKCSVTDSISLPKHTFAPYTLQKTSILIFRKRKSPLPVLTTDMKKLINTIKNEKISYFIVDNDGYANSDKRYPTKLRDSNGAFYHNDLSDWIDSNGILQTSKLYDALINSNTATSDYYNEFGEKMGKKYGCFSYLNCFTPIDRDLSLLAETYLRKEHDEMTYTDYKSRIDILEKYLSGVNNKLKGKFISELQELITVPVIFENEEYEKKRVDEFFEIKKGSQGFTEEVIYQNFTKKGIPVYGGGSKPTNFKVSNQTTNNKGNAVNIFESPAIVVSMDGSSGSMQIVRQGEFTANHHAAILKLKNEVNDFDLDWFVQSTELLLKKEASNQEGSATLTKERLEGFEVNIPRNRKLIVLLGNSRRKLFEILERFS